MDPENSATDGWHSTMTDFPLDPIEKATEAELKALQLERLKAQLAHA